MKRLRTHPDEGVKNSFTARVGVATLLRLVVLFWREKAGCPTGILPRAFSDMPRNWRGTASSTEDTTDALREAPGGGERIGDIGVSGRCCSASESSSSSSPIANALFSSGTSLSVGVRGTTGLLRLSRESARRPSPCSFLSWF